MTVGGVRYALADDYPALPVGWQQPDKSAGLLIFSAIPLQTGI
jgi:hypothetical protein